MIRSDDDEKASILTRYACLVRFFFFAWKHRNDDVWL